ncbi:F-box family protein [Dorcoceras hygrometricum]|uniref:F-box family protein n=1 Tax=Dorcoceras hygrometricum TaxID=472368 RepID=A0A2Z6ZUR7_9LAMI|nr:F-box family protein [Dorcoceras hygrometricum]
MSWEVQSQAFETNDWTTSCKHIVTTSWTTRRKQQHIQSRATVDPVASFSAIAYPVDMVSRRNKSISSEALHPDASNSSSRRELHCTSCCYASSHKMMYQSQALCIQSQALRIQSQYLKYQPLQAINAQDGRING